MRKPGRHLPPNESSVGQSFIGNKLFEEQQEHQSLLSPELCAMLLGSLTSQELFPFSKCREACVGMGYLVSNESAEPTLQSLPYWHWQHFPPSF